ncbi:hypothetical protein LIER_36357 [Lithospermum erythrorhizon]|uniref:Uncharacterized protein n=1 Tax=Lithospermum erythrorhizon TaxID=34254 RepID=A0AAV3P4R2_LITER
MPLKVGFAVRIGRKNIFKLAQGEYIAPEKIENMYMVRLKCDSFNSVLVAVVCVDPDVLRDWSISEGIEIKRPQAKEYFAKAISDMYAELATFDPNPSKMI